MHLAPHEKDRLLIHVAADVAERRRQRGLKLNYPEAVAVLTCWVYEAGRDGRTVVDLMENGRHVLTRDGVKEGIAEMIDEGRSKRPFPTVRSWSPSTSPSSERDKRDGRGTRDRCYEQ